MAETKRTLLERVDRNLKALLALFPVKLRLRFGTPEKRDNLPRGTPVADKTITDIETVTMTLEEEDAAGNAVPFDLPTPPTWTSSDETVATVEVSTDGSSARAVTTGKLGTTQIKVVGELVDGRAITGLGDLEVVTSAPTTFKLKFGAAVPK